MKKNFTDRIALMILSLFFISYGLYQGLKFVEKPYKTEIAYDYTVADSYTGKAVFIRDEVDFAVRTDSIVNYNYSDGARVRENSQLAECFADEDSARIVHDIHILEKEIENLKNINDNFSANYGATDAISKQISTNVAALNSDIFKGNFNSFSDRRVDIINCLNKKQINSGKTPNFNEKIDSLEREAEHLKSSLKSEPVEILSPVNGFFSSVTDMSGEKISSDMLDLFTPEFLEMIMENPPKIRDGYAKIVTSHNWYFALNVPNEQLPKFKEGRQVYVSFPLLNIEDVTATIYQINSDEEKSPDESVVILRCNYILDKITTTRITEVNVKFRAYSGLKINSQSIRFSDNVKGVYVIDDQQIKFKPIEVIYEGSGYVIIDMVMEGRKTVQCFDEVVVEGVELYDGKPV